MTSGGISLIESLQAKIHQSLSPLFDGSPFAILDFPDIRNCGDSAIWLGEIAYLDRHQAGARPSYVSRMRDFSAEDLKRAIGDGVIFIHGGGNFGDVWEAHQVFRERVIQAFPHNRIVQFPQSIHYASRERLNTTAKIINTHKDFKLIVRDEFSRELAANNFDCEAILCPDMAFAIGPLSRSGNTTKSILAMLRKDAEATGLDYSLVDGLPIEDWISESRTSVNISKIRGLASSIIKPSPATPSKFHMLNAAAENRFGRGRKQLSQANVIVTDRLHVHIVSLLLGIPHAVLDNSYGKLSRFMDTFSGGSELTYRASSLTDAIEWAHQRAGLV